jgi:hypothetical protein
MMGMAVTMEQRITTRKTDMMGSEYKQENQIYKTIPCNEKAISKVIGMISIMIWDKNRVYQIERNAGMEVA